MFYGRYTINKKYIKEINEARFDNLPKNNATLPYSQEKVNVYN